MIASHGKCSGSPGAWRSCAAANRGASTKLRGFLQRIVLALFLLLPSIGVHADTWFPLSQGYFGVPGAHLGSSIALRVGANDIVDRVYVGQPDTTDGTYAGCGSVQVYVPQAGGWKYSTTLFATQRQAGAHFGASLASSSGYLLVGAPDYAVGANNAGYAEFFRDTGTDAAPNIVSVRSIVATGGGFGSAVAMDSQMAAVARPSVSGGCVETFRYNVLAQTWNSFPAASNEFCNSNPGIALGASVAILQNGASSFVLVAGAPGENTLAGTAHVIIPNPSATGLLDFQTLEAANAASFDFFGTSVGIEANYIYVGATGRDNGAGRVGSVAIFKAGAILGYNYLDEYFPAAPATVGGHCGASLGVDAAHSQFILGCPDSDDAFYAKVGTARIYRRISFLGSPVWIESVLAFGTQPHNAGDSLGSSVAVSGQQAFTGVPNAHFTGQSGNGAWKAFLQDVIFRDGFQS